MTAPGTKTIQFEAGGALGVDFGTTNSAVALACDGATTLATFATPAGGTDTFPSVLYFERIRLQAGARVVSHAGPYAIDRYLDADDKGRFMQSLKALLADRRFDGTTVVTKRYTLEQLIALILHHLLGAANDALGPIPRRVVAGRPVHFSNPSSADDDALAVSRLLTAFRKCGFEEVVFEYEPVAAACSYEQRLDHDEIIVIGDFGGGTSDFSILRVGPGVRARGRTPQDIIGSDGVAVAGDAFDRQIIRNLVAPRLGKGSEYLAGPGRFLPIPDWPYERLERWHRLSFLKNSKDLHMLERLQRNASIPERLEAFIHLVRAELGYQLHEAVRRTKFELSTEDETVFEFECAPVTISKTVTRDDFERWIQEELSMIAGCVDGLLERSAVAATEVDRVFLTGGSSFVPAVRRIFEARFGADRITGGRELTSVATGLALRAAEEWPGRGVTPRSGQA
jgi:hypothetical chaperone protein